MYGGSHPTTVIVTGKNSQIHSGSDLNDRAVAVNGLRDLTQYYAMAWVDQHGGDARSVKLIEMPFSEIGVALAQGRVDAGIVAEPALTLAEAKNEVKELGDPEADVAARFVQTAWFASEDWVRRNPEAARRFAEAMRKTAVWANAHHKETAAILARYTKITPEIASSMVRVSYGDGGKLDPALFQPVIDVAVKYGGLPPVAAKDLLWDGR
jgi:NitT/TauT family transport system substrate-binding protein